MRTLLTGIFIIFCTLAARAEVQLVPFQFGDQNKTDIPTVFWPAAKSKATLIFLPGGRGSFGITNKADPKPSWVLEKIYSQADGQLNLVFMDSHFSLQGDFGDPYTRWSPRREAAHLESIKTAVKYYKEKFGQPVILFGHSNGTLSIAEFLNRDPNNSKAVAGVILSGSRNETELQQPLAIPILVLHHKTDSNQWTSPAHAEALYQSIRSINASVTELKWVEGGSDTGGDPTHTGKHMYHEATSEAADGIISFAQRVLK